MRSQPPPGAGPARRDVLLAGLGAGVLGATTAAPADAATSTPTATSSPAALPLALSLEEVVPTTYAAGGGTTAPTTDPALDPAAGRVVVRAAVRNTSTATVSGARARLVVQRTPATTREAVAAWAQAPATRSAGRTTTTSTAVELPDLTPGQRADVVLDVAAADLGTGPGAHLATVDVTADGARAGVLRTFLVAAAAPGTVVPTTLTLLLPVVAGRTDPGPLTGADGATAASLPTRARLAELVATGSDDPTGSADDRGRLARLLAAGSEPRTAWAVDPALVVAALTAAAPQPGPEDPSPTPDTADTGADEADRQAVAAWTADLRRLAGGRAVVALPFGDPDLSALARATPGPALLGAARTEGGDTVAKLADGDLPAVAVDLAWPADEAGDDDLLALDPADRGATVLLDDDCLTTGDDLTYTPTGRAVLGGAGPGGSDVDVVVADRTLSQLLTGLAHGSTTGAATVQRLLAEAATTSLQRPSDGRSLLLVAPRSFDPDPELLGAATSALEASGWAGWQPLTDLLAVPAPDVERSGPQLSAQQTAAELPARHLDAVAADLAALDDVATAVEGGASTTALRVRRRAALQLTAASWRGHLADLPAARAQLTDALDVLTAQVRVAAGSTRTLAATRSDLPVSLVNDLDVPVTVDLVLRPRTPRVQLDAVPRQTVPARSTQRVAVPVRALANGSVVVVAELRTPAGTRLGASADVRVDVRMDVETWLTGIVGGGAAGLLVLGLVRAVKRGRRRVDAAVEDLDAPGPSAGDAAQASGQAP